MQQFLHLLRYDFILLKRNQIIAVSVVATALYLGVFRWLSSLGNVEKLLVLIIFNDPAVLGFLFVGVMVLFEKNENTLQVLAVSPMEEHHYLWSKAVALTVVSVICCYSMAFATYGMHFHWFHFGMAAVLTTLLFTFIGFIAVAGESSFNSYLLKAVGILLFLALPFLGYFEVVSRNWFLWMPTQPAVDLFRASFQHIPLSQLVYGYVAITGWLLVSYFMALRTFRKSMR